MRTRTVDLNPSGRDLVVGDVHGCFRTLDRALREVGFDPECDRLFGVGDLVNRGPHSAEALDWLEHRFDAVTLGNHERPLIAWFRARLLKRRTRSLPWLREIAPGDYQRWFDALVTMPLALTIQTRYGLVGVVHAQVPDPVWDRAVDLLEAGTDEHVNISLLGHETPGGEERARAQPVTGVRSLVHGHFPVTEVMRVGNRWNIDTGAGIGRGGRLSLLEVNSRDMHNWTFGMDER